MIFRESNPKLYLRIGVKGFEPLNARTKNDRLATWLYSISSIITESLFQIFFFIR
jgi:hypothetical protein